MHGVFEIPGAHGLAEFPCVSLHVEIFQVFLPVACIGDALLQVLIDSGGDFGMEGSFVAYVLYRDGVKGGIATVMGSEQGTDLVFPYFACDHRWWTGHIRGCRGRGLQG